MISVYRWSEADGTGAWGGPEALGSGPGADVTWVDLEAPTPEEEALVFEHFLPVHPLTLEDMTRPRRHPDQLPHFPKVEEFRDYLFVVVNPLSPAAHKCLGDSSPRPPDDPVRLTTQLSVV